MITRPDEYKHQNDNYAIVDNDNVRGGIFDLVTISNANLLTLPLDKRQLRTTITNGSDNKHYVYTGSTLDDTAWGTVGNWTVASGSGYTHPTGFTNQPSVALTSGNVISQITVNSNGHTTGVVSRLLTPSDIGAAATSHTHSNATASVAGFMSGTDKTKLDGITAGAEANQNAFSYVTVGATTLSATGDTDTLTLTAGTGITLTPDALTKSVVVSSTGSGTSAYGFGTVAVSGQSSVVADSTNDTLNLVAGSGITLTTNAITDNITITNSDRPTSIPIGATTITVTDTEMTAEELVALFPVDSNLGGKSIRVVFTPGVTYNIDCSALNSSIAISRFFNGEIVFKTTTTGSKAILNMEGSTTWNAIGISQCDLVFKIIDIDIIFATTVAAVPGNHAGLLSTNASGYGGRSGDTCITNCNFTLTSLYTDISIFRLGSANNNSLVLTDCVLTITPVSKWYLVSCNNTNGGNTRISLYNSSTGSTTTFDSTFINSYRYNTAVVCYINSTSLIKFIPGTNDAIYLQSNV